MPATSRAVRLCHTTRAQRTTLQVATGLTLPTVVKVHIRSNIIEV